MNQLTNDSVVGTCSLCGGAVCVPQFYHSIAPPTPTCRSCGATAKPNYGPVIPMEHPGWTTTTLDVMLDNAEIEYKARCKAQVFKEKKMPLLNETDREEWAKAMGPWGCGHVGFLSVHPQSSGGTQCTVCANKRAYQ